MGDVVGMSATCPMREFQVLYHAKYRDILKSIFEAFEIATKLLNKKARVDVVPLTKPVSVTDVPVVSQTKANKEQTQFALVQHKLIMLGGDLSRDNKMNLDTSKKQLKA